MRLLYTDYLADFKEDFHDIRNQDTFADCLDPDSYIASQSLATRLFNMNSAGIVYPNVRYEGGANVACFRPALVNNVRKSDTCRLVWNDTKEPEVTWIGLIP